MIIRSFEASGSQWPCWGNWIFNHLGFIKNLVDDKYHWITAIVCDALQFMNRYCCVMRFRSLCGCEKWENPSLVISFFFLWTLSSLLSQKLVKLNISIMRSFFLCSLSISLYLSLSLSIFIFPFLTAKIRAPVG